MNHNNNRIPQKPKQGNMTMPVAIFLLLAIVLFSCYLALLVFRNYSADNETDTSVEFKGPIILDNSIANWKTYKSEKYGFEFKYPPDAQVDPGVYGGGIPVPGEYYFEISFPNALIDGPPGYIAMKFSVQPTRLRDNDELLSQEELKIQNNINIKNSRKVISESFLNMGTAVVISGKSYYPPVEGDPFVTISDGVLVVSGSYLFTFDDYRSSSFDGDFRKIMDTFRFTN